MKNLKANIQSESNSAADNCRSSCHGDPPEVKRVRADNRSSRLNLFVPLLVCVCGLAISFTAFFFTSSWEAERQRSHFERLAEVRCSLFQNDIEHHVRELKALERFYNGSKFVDNREFGDFTIPVVMDRYDLQAFAWAPRVLNSERASFEKDARAQGLIDYAIHEPIATENDSTVSERDEYYPILYYHPSVEWALGWDLLSEPMMLGAIKRAIQTGQPSASPQLRLPGHSTGESYVIVFQPVYDNIQNTESEGNRRKSLKGLVLAIFQPGDALEGVLKPLKASGIHIQIADLSAFSGKQIVYRHWSGRHDQDTLDAHIETFDADGLVYTTSFDFAGRIWELTCKASSSYLSSNIPWIPWTWLVGGFLLTIMLTSQIHAQRNRTRIVEKLVVERTAHLRDAKKTQTALLRISEAAVDIDSLALLLEVVCDELSAVIDTTNFYVALYDEDTNLYSFPFCNDEYNGTDFPPQQLEKGLTDYVRRTGKPLLIDKKVHQSLEAKGEVELVGKASAIWLGVPLIVSHNISGVMVVQDYSDPERYSKADLELLSSVSQSLSQVIERQVATEQTQALSEKLERAQRMESIGVLAGGVAHDLNNMIGPLVGYPELILRKLPEESPIRNQIQKMQSSAKQAADVIQDLLTLARRGCYEMSPVLLNDVLDSYLESPGFLQLMESNPFVTLHTNFDKSVSCIQGSASHLYKTMMNLIMNAIEAMPDGGELTIETSQGNITTLASGHRNIEPGDYAMVRVTDTGSGIDCKDLGRVFEPYYSNKEMGISGSGLGLSVVYGIVKDHHGYYDVFSEKGIGTTFILYFPVSKDQAVMATKPVEVIEGNESVLVVDDSDEQRDLAFDVLSSLGYQVTVVASGREAVNFIQGRSVDIVVIDMIMEPGFDGLETYREIVKLRPEQKAIIVSGFSQTDRVNEMHRLGAGRYVRKPYTADELGIAIRAELDEPISAPQVGLSKA